jgi:hypothetical protein
MNGKLSLEDLQSEALNAELSHTMTILAHHRVDSFGCGGKEGRGGGTADMPDVARSKVIT